MASPRPNRGPSSTAAILFVAAANGEMQPLPAWSESSVHRNAYPASRRTPTFPGSAKLPIFLGRIDDVVDLHGHTSFGPSPCYERRADSAQIDLDTKNPARTRRPARPPSTPGATVRQVWNATGSKIERAAVCAMAAPVLRADRGNFHAYRTRLRLGWRPLIRSSGPFGTASE